mgnify:CR=1 FL=1
MKRDPKNSRRPNDGAANLAMLKRTVKKLFSYYPVLAPVTFACILFSAIVTSIPSLFVQNVIQVIEKWYVSRDWVSAKAELIPILSLLISLYVLSIIAILVYKQLMAYMTQGFLDKLRQEMFGGMQDLPQMNYCKFRLALDIFSELGLVQQDLWTRQVHRKPVSAKVDLQQSVLLQGLQKRGVDVV